MSLPAAVDSSGGAVVVVAVLPTTATPPPITTDAAVARWLGASQWPPTKARWLKTEATRQYVEDYLRYRKGYSKGAKGEITEVIIEEKGAIAAKLRRAAVAAVATKPAGAAADAADWEATANCIFGAVEDEEHSEKLKVLERYRRAYRLFRSGSNRGAEGEIGKIAGHFTREHLQLLPVAQLAGHLEASRKRDHGSSTSTTSSNAAASASLTGGAGGGAAAASAPTPSSSSSSSSSSVEVPEATFHCHIGCGRLGCGLILPMICASGCPFAVLQVPLPEWDPVLKREVSEPGSLLSLPVEVNGEHLCTLRVIRSLDELVATGYLKGVEGRVKDRKNPTEEELKELTFIPPRRGTKEAHDARLLILDSALHPVALRAADAISTALGPALPMVVDQLAQVLPSPGPQPPRRGFSVGLYCCENDHKAVAAVRPALEGRGIINIRECMVDRICSDRVVEEDKVVVTAEPYAGEIVVTARDSTKTVRPGFGSRHVHLPDSSAAYNYLYNRKVLLVNGSHTTLAFMTLRSLCKNPDEAPGDFELFTPDSLSDGEKRELYAWLAARCLVLLHSHEDQIIQTVHNVKTGREAAEDLWNFATNTVLRFNTVKDTTKRVLGGGVANRYETRLKDVLTTIETFNRTVPYSSDLLRIAGFRSVEEITENLRKLVNDGEIFVS